MFIARQAIPLAVLLIKLAHGLPNAPAPSSTPVWSISQVAEFDNIADLPAIGAASVGSNSIYENLKFNGFSLVQTEATDVETPLLIPQSTPNIIGFGLDDDETISEGTPMITVNYADSSIIYFTLGNFFYGCTAATEASVVGVPVSCNITSH